MIYDTAVMVENMMQVCPDQEVVPLPSEEAHWELALISAKDYSLSPQARQVRDTILNLLRLSKIVNKERDEAIQKDSSLSFLSFILQT